MKIQFAGCLKNKKQKMADKLHIQTKDESPAKKCQEVI